MKRLFQFALSLWVAAAGLSGAESVIISEFMASNTRTLADENGSYEDWIEISNTGDTGVNLGGWYLTDDVTTLTKWQFPATNIGPGQFIIVFASGKDRRIPGTNLHTNFKLSAGGEYLALVKPDGSSIASEYAPLFPPQAQDVSYGVAVVSSPVTLLAPGAAGRFLVPRDGALGTNWVLPAFNDATWSNVTTGVGFDTNQSPVITNLLGSDVGARMRGSNSSAYLRVPFVVTNAADFDGLTLRMFYDDGFVAYLNGTVVASRNAPGPASAGGNFANSASDWSTSGQQGYRNWHYGFWNRTADLDGLYTAATDFTASDPNWAWTGSAWTLGPGDPPWDYIDAASWHPNGDNNGHVDWVIRRWVSETAGALTNRISFAKGNGGCGNGTTLRVLVNGVEKLRRTVAYNDTTGFTTNLVLQDILVGDFIDFALDSLGTDGTQEDGCDGSTFSVTIDGQASAGLLWNSTATAARPPAQVGVPEEIDISIYRDFLVTGTNVLAIHGLNVSTNDADFLLLPQIIGASYAYDPTQHVYFAVPTPGAINSPGSTTLGPIISDVSHAPNVPTTNEALWVRAVVTPTLRPVGYVTLRYRVMFGAETGLPMFDDGQHGDGGAGDGVYGAAIPAGVATPGQMVRYYVVAGDAQSNEMRSPAFADPLHSPEYYGTVVANPALAASRLPVLHWFTENPFGRRHRCRHPVGALLQRRVL